MALCSRCRTGISPSEAKRARTEKDADGRIKGVFHYKCWFKRAKVARFKGEGRDTGPDAYEMSLDYRNRDDLREEAVKRRKLAEANYEALLDVAVSGPLPEFILLAAQDDLALAKRQEELAEDRMKEAAPSTEGDWRGPIEGEI